LVGLYGLAASTIQILISAKLSMNSIPAVYTYWISLSRSISSTGFSKMNEKVKPSKMIRTAIFVILSQGAFFLIIGLVLNLPLYFIANIGIGFSTVLLYGFGLKMVLDRNQSKNTVVYSCIFQFANGFMSAVIPYLAGYGAQYNIDLVIILIGLGTFVLAGILLVLQQIYAKRK
jgi:hypothetical protein